MSGDEHASEDRLEEYCLGRASATEIEELENHILVCPACRSLLEQTDMYVNTMRQAVAALAKEAPARKERWRGWFASFFHPLPVVACAGIGALVLVWGVGSSLRTGDAAPVAVALESARGGEGSLRAHAPERTPLLLTLDLTGVAPLPAYQVRIVDAQGSSLFTVAAKPNAGRLEVHGPAGLRRGTYWVRLYDRAPGDSLLREYGLELQ